ncbi:MAG TPA: sigma factor-like helix-turn-helix DNA-binding protein, partial [Dongiaceae bacterium]|nr:sigma factor-like helix-turn-helix DNA-binding protein [Dongiaceae bacterium]
RFFEDRTFKDIGATLGITEAGAKMRVSRALEKLRTALAKRGLVLSATALATAIMAHSVHAAPAGLAASVTVTAVTGTTVTTSTLTLIKSTLKIMAWTKLKTAVVVGAVALLVAGTATVVMRHTHVDPEATPYHFAGYATPEASVQSMLWAASHGDIQNAFAASTPEQRQRIEQKMAGMSQAEMAHEFKSWAYALHDYQITGKDVISETEVHLHIHASPSAAGLHSGKVVVIMQKVGADWKQAGDL